MNIYKIHEIIKIFESNFIVYICFERISDGKYTTLSAEICRGRLIHKRLLEIICNTSELISEFVDEDYSWYETLDQAISVHDKDFSNS